MSLHLEKCSHCGHAYLLEQFSPAFGPGLIPGMIQCPHCDDVEAGDGRFVYVGHKLPPQVEQWPQGDG